MSRSDAVAGRPAGWNRQQDGQVSISPGSFDTSIRARESGGRRPPLLLGEQRLWQALDGTRRRAQLERSLGDLWLEYRGSGDRQGGTGSRTDRSRSRRGASTGRFEPGRVEGGGRPRRVLVADDTRSRSTACRTPERHRLRTTQEGGRRFAQLRQRVTSRLKIVP